MTGAVAAFPSSSPLFAAVALTRPNITSKLREVCKATISSIKLLVFPTYRCSSFQPGLFLVDMRAAACVCASEVAGAGAFRCCPVGAPEATPA